MQNWKTNDFMEVLNDNGYRFIRQRGSHQTFENSSRRITVAVHGYGINGLVARKIIKEYNLKHDIINKYNPRIGV